MFVWRSRHRGHQVGVLMHCCALLPGIISRQVALKDRAAQAQDNNNADSHLRPITKPTVALLAEQLQGIGTRHSTADWRSDAGGRKTRCRCSNFITVVS